MKLLIKRLHEDAIIPEYATKGSVAFDLHSLENYVVIGSQIVRVRTGIAVAIPEGYEINARARSGLSLKYPNYLVITGGGTIDNDYRGEITIPVINRTKNRWEIKKGDRLIQCIVAPIKQVEMEEVNELPETERGTGGWGHTGV